MIFLFMKIKDAVRRQIFFLIKVLRKSFSGVRNFFPKIIFKK